jgi:hypothetical protein
MAIRLDRKDQAIQHHLSQSDSCAPCIDSVHSISIAKHRMIQVKHVAIIPEKRSCLFPSLQCDDREMENEQVVDVKHVNARKS